MHSAASAGCETVNGGRSSVGRAPDCDSGGRGFETHRPPHFSLFSCYAGRIDTSIGPLAQLVEQWTLNPLVEGSNPSWPTTSSINPDLECSGFFVSTEEFEPSTSNRPGSTAEQRRRSRVMREGPSTLQGSGQSGTIFFRCENNLSDTLNTNASRAGIKVKVTIIENRSPNSTMAPSPR